MAQENSDKIVWFLAGASIGAAIALLYAPASGEETRAKIKARAGEIPELLGDQGKELMERGRELYDKGRSMADEAAEMFDRGKKMMEG